ncbi:MAG TPA: hypothetical protein VGQ53_18250 [Chitinophagaceae bacterium]|jgi:hypothetical protein|nr:hypothetical protein [Chitinophagaceae bacterium]
MNRRLSLEKEIFIPVEICVTCEINLQAVQPNNLTDFTDEHQFLERFQEKYWSSMANNA